MKPAISLKEVLGIVSTACAFIGVSVSEIVNNGEFVRNIQKAKIVETRKLAIWLTLMITGTSIIRLARLMKLDHSTLVKLLKGVNEEYELDVEIQDLLQRLREGYIYEIDWEILASKERLRNICGAQESGVAWRNEDDLKTTPRNYFVDQNRKMLEALQKEMERGVDDQA